MTRTEKTNCLKCRKLHKSCIQSDNDPTKCEYCYDRDFDCIYFKPNKIEEEIIRLHKLVKERDEQIALLQKQLLHYNIIKHNLN